MSCWLTIVSPLLKSRLASEAKESRDKRHSHTSFASKYSPQNGRIWRKWTTVPWKTWVKTENSISTFSKGKPREAFHWSRPGFSSFSCVFLTKGSNAFSSVTGAHSSNKNPGLSWPTSIVLEHCDQGTLEQGHPITKRSWGAAAKMLLCSTQFPTDRSKIQNKALSNHYVAFNYPIHSE